MLFRFLRFTVITLTFLVVHSPGLLAQEKTVLVPLAPDVLPVQGKVLFLEYPIKDQNFGFFMSEEKVSILQFDGDMAFQERLEFKTDKKVRTGNLLGAYRNENSFYLLGNLQDEKAYFVYTFTPGEKPKLELNGPIRGELDGELVACLSYPNRMVALTVIEGTSKVNLNIFSGAGQFQAASVDLSSWVRGLSFTEMLKENQIGTTGYYPYLGAASVIEKEITNDFRITRRKLKIYQVEDNVIFSLDHLKGTNLAIVGLSDFSVRFNEFKGIPLSTEYGKIKQTTLIYGSSLYMLALNTREIALRVADIYTGKMLNLYLNDITTGCELARTEFKRYLSKPFTEETIDFESFLKLSADAKDFEPALSALRESKDGMELAIGLNYFEEETWIDITAMVKTRLSLDGSVLLAGAPNETAADDAIGYEKLILRPWGLRTQRLGDKLLIATYNPESQKYVVALWPLVTGAAN